MAFIEIEAVTGRLVRDPATRRVITDQPVRVDADHPHWARLLRDGDVAPVQRKESGK